MIDTTVAHYKITAKIGEGGMGEVYRATDTRLNRDVAIKILPAHFANDTGRLARFKREAQSLAALNHPNICALYDLGEFDHRPYLVMELLEGTSLEESTSEQPLAQAQVLDILAQLAAALGAAHQRGIVHRDLKPANIHLTPDGRVKILDFGLAKADLLDGERTAAGLTEAGAPLGTVAYMSPEQALGREIDHRSDLFSLGAVCYQLLAKRLPFEADSALSLLNAIITEAHTPLTGRAPGVSESLSGLIDRLLAKDPADRPDDAAVLAEEIETLKTRISSPQLASVVGRSIAVLPLTNLSDNPDNEYFGYGLTEELINALAAIEGIRVASRTSAFTYENSSKSVTEIGRELGVETVLEGSVRRAEDRIRITVQLINVEDGYSLWSERFDGQMSDIFEVQDEITSRIVERLTDQLAVEGAPTAVDRHTENPAAYDLYLEGRHYWAQRTAGSLKRAMSKFEEAIRLDSRYALPYVGLAEGHFVMAAYGIGMVPAAIEKAQRAANRARELRPDLPEVYRCLGNLASWWDRDDAAAERFQQQALELAPDDGLALAYRAITLAMTDRLKEAADIARRAEAKDPSAMTATLCGVAHLVRRDFDSALETCRRAAQTDPGHAPAAWFQGMASLFKGDAESALRHTTRAVFLSHGITVFIGGAGCAYAMSGDRETAEATVALLQIRADHDDPSTIATSIASIRATLGEVEEARRILVEIDPAKATRTGPYAVFAPILSRCNDPAIDHFIEKLIVPVSDWRDAAALDE